MFNMFDLEEYINKFNQFVNINICCNRKTGGAEDTNVNGVHGVHDINKDTFNRKRKLCDLRYVSDHRQARNVRFCELPANASVDTSADANAGTGTDTGTDADTNSSKSCEDVDAAAGIDINDNILKIKEELENSMSFKYQSVSLRSPRTPIN